mgnify:CR=1 FL=1
MPDNKDDILDPQDFDEEANNSELEDEDDNSLDDEDEDDTSTEEEEEEKVKAQKSKTSDKETQKKRNAHFAEERRKREALERENKIKEQAKVEAQLELVKTNPYTEEPIKDEEDLKIYLIQKELEENGKDPITDLPRKMAELNREAQKKAKDASENDRKLKEDIANFHNDFPDVDLSALAKDEDYINFALDKLDRMSTSEIYELYQSKKAKDGKKKEDKEKKTKTDETVDETAKKMTKTPPSTQGKSPKAKSVNEMTDEEFKAYWKQKYGN